jgi:uridine kinase
MDQLTTLKIKEGAGQALSFREIMEPLLVFFNYAVNQVLPRKEYYISYSVPGGVYGYFKNYEVQTPELEKILEVIKQELKSNNSINKNILDKKTCLARFEGINRNDLSNLILSVPGNTNPNFRIAEYKNCNEIFLNDIKLHIDELQEINLVKFKKGFILIADKRFFRRTTPENLEASKYVKRFNELDECMKYFGIGDIAGLNNKIRSEELPEFIKISEAFQDKKIMRIADKILDDKRKPRLVFIAGPTSSGKTTFAYRLSIALKLQQKKVLKLSLDDYYLPHSKILADPETGLQNFEVISALDLDLFRENILSLVKGLPVNLPKYNFNKGGHTFNEKATQIDKDTLIIVEGIHGLNPEMWKNINSIESYRIYISALNTLNIHYHLPISTSDHRLIRRLVRDSLFRGYDFNETISRWPDVMKSEYHNIFPFQESAHTVFNSSLVYELAVFAHYAPKVLQIEKSQNNYIREQVERLFRLLSLFIPIDPQDIPPTSILREFIGGSSFKY